MKIEFAESSVCALEDIRSYYPEEAIAKDGEHLIIEIKYHIETLPDNSIVGRQIPEVQMPTVREFIHSPFCIVYLLNQAIIQIIKVWRSEPLRQLPKI